MALLNTSKEFFNLKKPSRPVYDIPKNVKQALNIDEAYENGMFKIEPGDKDCLYDSCYLFEDINYISQDRDEKTRTLRSMIDFFKGLSAQVKITVASEQQDPEEMLKSLYHPVHEDDYTMIADPMKQFFEQKLEEGSKDIRRSLLLTITCRAVSRDDAKAFFSVLDTTMNLVFHSLGSKLIKLDAKSRLLLISRMFRFGQPGFPISPEMLKSDDWKNQVMPGYIEQDDEYMEMDGRYGCVLYGADYRRALDPDKVIHALTGVSFPVYVTTDIEPIPPHLLAKRLEKVHANNERTKELERGRKRKDGGESSPTYRTVRKEEQIETLMEQMDDNDEGGVYVGFLVMTFADDLDTLETRVDTLIQLASDNAYNLYVYHARQLKAMNTVIPIGGRSVDVMRPFFTSEAVVFNPFKASDLKSNSPERFVYGINRLTKQLLLGDRKQLNSPHGIVCGGTGGGKSFLVKTTEVAQTLLFTNDRIFYLDPMNEAESVIHAFHGQYYDFTPHSSYHLNPFEIPERIWKATADVRDQFIAVKCSYAVAFLAASMRNIPLTSIYENIIHKAVTQMYQLSFAKTKMKRQPTFTLLFEILKVFSKESAPYEEAIYRNILGTLEIYITGVYDMFAYESNLEMHNRLIGFGMNKVPEDVWEQLMLTIMHFMKQQIEFNQEFLEAQHGIIDEAQRLCKRDSSAEQFLDAYRTQRKEGVIITACFQNLTGILEHPLLRDMFQNSGYKCFIDSGGVDAKELSQIQELSAAEYAALTSKETGCGVMVWGGKVFQYDLCMDKQNPLYEIFNTNFHEKARAEREGVS